MDQSFKSEILQVKGYSYATQLNNATFILTTTYDYTKMNIKEELERGKELLRAKGLVDENFIVPYAKVIQAYTELGFATEKVFLD